MTGLHSGVWIVEAERIGIYARMADHGRNTKTCIARCDDQRAAIAIADALQTFVASGIVDGRFRISTRRDESGKEVEHGDTGR